MSAGRMWPPTMQPGWSTLVRPGHYRLGCHRRLDGQQRDHCGVDNVPARRTFSDDGRRYSYALILVS